MPRTIDYKKSQFADCMPEYISPPVYGKNEMSGEEIHDRTEAVRVLNLLFMPQFFAKPAQISKAYGHKMDQAHTWLSTHCSGPWYWNEGWANHGHAITTDIYVERLPDQHKAEKALGDLFDYHPRPESELINIAMLRGVLPVPTAKDDFFVWMDQNFGFDVQPIDTTATPRVVAISFNIEAFEKKFVKDWGHLFKATQDQTTKQNIYVGSWAQGRNETNDMSLWLMKNAAIAAVVGGGRSSDKRYEWKVGVRYPETEEALVRDWGTYFVKNKKTGLYCCKQLPRAPEPEIPQDFQNYIKGRRKTYAAPYLAK